MKCCKWLLLYFFMEFILAGCIPETSRPTIQPTQTVIVEETISPSPTNISSLPAWCKGLKQEGGLPAANKLRNSNIIYQAFAFSNGKYVDNQVWTVSMRDGSDKLLADNFPDTEFGSDQYDVNGNGFLLDSPDHKHIAIWGHWFESSNADGTYSLIIRNKDNGQDIDVFHSNPAERIDGSWSPDGKYFVFTWYKNIPEYYSVVYSVNNDGTGLEELTEHINKETLERPYWSPDGKKIAIPVWGRDGGMHIMVINFQTGNVSRFKVSPIIRLYPPSIFSGQPQNTMAWSSDNQWFAYISQYKHNGIEILNTENGDIYCGENEKILDIDKIVWHYDNP